LVEVAFYGDNVKVAYHPINEVLHMLVKHSRDCNQPPKLGKMFVFKLECRLQFLE